MRAIVNDPDEWVKYGAGRSLVEIAATTRDQARRSKIIAILTEGMRTFPDKVIEEIAGTARFTGAESAWPSAALPLVKEAQLRLSTEIRKKKLAEVLVALGDQTSAEKSE